MKTKNIALSPLNLKLVLPVVILVLVTLCSCAAKRMHTKVNNDNTSLKTSTSLEEPFVVVEQMPVFPGGDSTLLAYIAQNTKYPESAKINKITGRVIVRFCIESTGIVDRISVMRGVSPDIDAEALRVVGTLPAFQPGKQGGKSVPVWYMVPITYDLK